MEILICGLIHICLIFALKAILNKSKSVIVIKCCIFCSFLIIPYFYLRRFYGIEKNNFKTLK